MPCFKFVNRNDALSRLHNDLCIIRSHMAEAFLVRGFTKFPFEMSCVYLFREPMESAREGGRNPVGCTVRETFDIRWRTINALLRLGVVVHVTRKFLEVCVWSTLLACRRYYPGRSDGICSLVRFHHLRPSP